MQLWVTSEEWFRLAEHAAIAEARALDVSGAEESSLAFRVEQMIEEREELGLQEERAAWQTATGTAA